MDYVDKSSSDISLPAEGTSAPRSAKRLARPDPTRFRAMQGGGSTTSCNQEPSASAAGIRDDVISKRFTSKSLIILEKFGIK